MKTILGLCFVLFSVNVTAQAGRKVAECPIGTHPVLTFSFDQFNFHKPRTNCASGFGLCVRGTWSTTCVPNSHFRGVDAQTYINGNMVYGWGEIINSKLELHIPLELASQTDRTLTDISLFSINSGDISISHNNLVFESVGGDYMTQIINNEIVILIDIE